MYTGISMETVTGMDTLASVMTVVGVLAFIGSIWVYKQSQKLHQANVDRQSKRIHQNVLR